ncbi:MAG: hypothetical protein MUC83_02535 [Pirellula sp.]|nr:hypothetical protein [Pirellula sp.]
MLSETSLQSNQTNSGSNLPQLKVSNVDKVASLLMSCFIMVSASVCFLGAVFFLSKIQQSEREPVDPQDGGGSERSEYLSALEKSDELREFPDSENWKDVFSDQALDSVTLVSLIEENVSGVSEAYEGKGQKGVGKEFRGEGDQGDGDGSFSVPAATRLELKFSAKDRKSYAKQLESFGIELGVYGAGRPIVEYASGLTNVKPTYRSGSPAEERRPYFMSVSRSALKEFDQQLLRLAGIDLLGRQPIKFVSRETETKLLELEVDYAHAKMGTGFPLRRVVRTVFECRPNANGNGFEIVVVSQRYKAN